MMKNVDLLQAIVKRLSGFDVTVRLIKPAVINAAALCHQSPNGKRFIDINPELHDETFLHFFLHECAHWKINNGEMRRSLAHTWAAGSVDLDADGVVGKRLEDKHEEEAADVMAVRWNLWAEANSNPALYAINKTVAKTIQLLAYKKDG